jgi:hypothetical protein
MRTDELYGIVNKCLTKINREKDMQLESLKSKYSVYVFNNEDRIAILNTLALILEDKLSFNKIYKLLEQQIDIYNYAGW